MTDWQSKLDGRLMRADTLHVTLVFIGEIERSRLLSLQLAAREVIASRFSVCFTAIRYWQHNRILYAGTDLVPDALLQLVSQLQNSLTRHNFNFASHLYTPHVTLLRRAHLPETPLPNMKPVCWKVKDYVLVESKEGVADYRVLARFALE